MGCVPVAAGMSAELKRMHEVEEPGQEAIWASQRRREMSKAIGATKAMEMASDTMGDEMVRMAQQAAHAATRNESKQDH